MKRNAAVWLIQSHKYVEVDVDTIIKRVEHKVINVFSALKNHAHTHIHVYV